MENFTNIFCLKNTQLEGEKRQRTSRKKQAWIVRKDEKLTNIDENTLNRIIPSKQSEIFTPMQIFTAWFTNSTTKINNGTLGPFLV